MKQPRLGTRLFTTGTVVTIAVIASVVLALRLTRHPWTRDGQVRADIVMVAPRVTGVVVQVGAVSDQFVQRGTVLFQIDPSDYELAVATASVQLDDARQQVAALEAAVVAAEAGVSEARAGITTALAQADSAQAQISAAEGGVAAAEAKLKSGQAAIDQTEAELEEAKRESERAKKLADEGAGAVATAESKAAAVQAAQAALDGARADLEEAQADLSQSRAGLLQAQAGLTSAEAGEGEARARLVTAEADLVQARANLGVAGEENVQIRSAKVNLASAELDLERTTLRAPTDGYVTNLSVDVGDYAAAGTPLLAFVDSASFYVQGFFRETQLAHIALGDRALVTIMGRRGEPIEGVVESIGYAINPPDVATIDGSGGLVPQVEPSFDWIRLAQRVPVRVKLGEIPEGIQLISGTTVSVVVEPETEELPIYEYLAVLAAFGLVYSAVAGAIERTWISGPIVFISFGLLFGPLGLGMLPDSTDPEALKTLAELTLALVLFTDASGAHLGVLRRVRKLPMRLLGIGLPLTILLGYGLGLLLFDDLTALQVALVATMLAPTDAALGKAVVTNEAVPDPVRQGLNVESGLNDGICVPILFLFLTLLGETGEGKAAWRIGLELFVESVGIGVATGAVVTLVAVWLIKLARRRDWLSPTWSKVTVIALAFVCFGTAQALGGSGFIACFAGGLLFGGLLEPHHEKLFDAAEGIGDTFSLLTWVLFGSAVVGQSVGHFDVAVVLYALASLTVIRMLPVYLSVAGLGFTREGKLFLGWFGPRGLASIVFAVIVMGSDVPQSATISTVVVCTVFLSIVLHGVTANPWARAFGARAGELEN